MRHSFSIRFNLLMCVLFTALLVLSVSVFGQEPDVPSLPIEMPEHVGTWWQWALLGVSEALAFVPKKVSGILQAVFIGLKFFSKKKLT